MRVFSLLALLTLSACASATSPWPPYINQLYPALAESPETASFPGDLQVSAPADGTTESRRGFSGRWTGWACRAWFCSVGVAVEAIDETGVRLVYSRAYAGHPSRADRVQGEFVGDELHASIPNGTKLIARLRHRAGESSDVMEMILLSAEGQLRAAGVLSQREYGYRRSIERIATPFNREGETVSLEMVVHRPTGKGPYPTLIFHHGSTGRGDNPRAFKWTSSNPTMSQYFTRRGWQVFFPQRRGRGNSGGEYAEGLAADGSGYSCDRAIAIGGAERALKDLDVITDHVLSREDVDKSHVLIGGISRGGVLAIVHAASSPERFVGAINFAGGWIGQKCPTIQDINPPLFARGSGGNPSLWVYGDDDPFYNLEHSRGNFSAFEAAGGKGEFVTLDPPAGTNGHALWAFPHTWNETMDGFLERLR